MTTRSTMSAKLTPAQAADLENFTLHAKAADDGFRELARLLLEKGCRPEAMATGAVLAVVRIYVENLGVLPAQRAIIARMMPTLAAAIEKVRQEKDEPHGRPN